MNKPEFLIALFAFVSAPITLPHVAPLQALVAWQTPDALRAVPAAWSFAATSTSPALQAPSAVTTDRTDAASTAAAILRAYASKDLPAMADLSTADNRQIIRELIAQGEAHPRWRSIFSGGRWHAVSTWTGVLGEVRYQERTPSTGRVIDARVQFAEAETPGKLVVVSLTWEAGKWCFEDVNFPSRESFTSWSKDKPKLPQPSAAQGYPEASLGRIPEARASYEKALALLVPGKDRQEKDRKEPERRFLARRLEELK